MRVLPCLALTIASAGAALAQTSAPVRPQPGSASAISPIFGQLVMFSQPLSFRIAFEQATATGYLREAVPQGQSAQSWTEMITVTGAKGLAKQPGASAKGFATAIAAGFNRACPDTFAARDVPMVAVSGHETAVLLAGCGRVADQNGTRSESAIIIAIKGDTEMYTLQWAVRTPVAASAPSLGDPKWSERLRALQPVRLCAIVPGEKAPFPSCASRTE